METLVGPIEWGAATFTLRGQTESGDRFVVAPSAFGVLVAAIDGLGHGDEAALAARLAAHILEQDPNEPVIALVERCHERLRSTRGVVMSLASFNTLDETMTWLGVGNVGGRFVRASRDATLLEDRRRGERRMRSQWIAVDRRRAERRRPKTDLLLLRAGVVGSHLPPLSSADLPVLPGDTLVFATDGVDLPPEEDVTPAERPQAMAERILSKHKKETDDALVVVVRWVGLHHERSVA
jgi:phosphoserine phosphatase RsbX